MAETTMPKQRRRGVGRPFTKGRSGNPRGRPVGARHRAIVALDRIGEDAASDILTVVVAAARGGDIRAAEILLRRVWPERKGRPISIDLPTMKDAITVQDALARVVSATANGALMPDEGEALANLLDRHRAAIETLELDARLRALEARVETNEQGD
jgi:hypothetical protein